MRRFAPVLAVAAFALGACYDPMMDRGRIKPLEPSPFFQDGHAARPLVAGTIPRGALGGDLHLETGRIDGKVTDLFPFAVTPEVVDRGRERYEIFCAPCHDRAGFGRGMVVRRGFRTPASFHEDRLRDMPAGHFVDVMTNGFGAMPSYQRQLSPKDRWAVTAWVRVLQLSQRVPAASLTDDERAKLAEVPK